MSRLKSKKIKHSCSNHEESEVHHLVETLLQGWEECRPYYSKLDS